jgi:periplasmic divalent cation tolerance protein
MTDEGKACVVVLVTCKDADQAKQISSVLLEQHEAACVNVIHQLTSFFRWQGKIERADEVLLLIKTSADLFESVRQTVKKCHSYQTPEIIALPVIDGDADYLSWIREETENETK